MLVQPTPEFKWMKLMFLFIIEEMLQETISIFSVGKVELDLKAIPQEAFTIVMFSIVKLVDVSNVREPLPRYVCPLSLKITLFIYPLLQFTINNGLVAPVIFMFSIRKLSLLFKSTAVVLDLI